MDVPYFPSPRPASAQLPRRAEIPALTRSNGSPKPGTNPTTSNPPCTPVHSTASTQPHRIHKINRIIQHIPIQINPTGIPNRINLQKPPNRRIICSSISSMLIIFISIMMRVTPISYRLCSSVEFLGCTDHIIQPQRINKINRII